MSDPSLALASARFDLRQARVLCADDSSQGLDILSQILVGFGVQNITRVETADDLAHQMGQVVFDLVLIDGGFAGNGHEQVQGWRRGAKEANRFAPIIVVSGHTPRERVELARDCGANFVVTKPLRASVLLERIMWLAKSPRLFVEAGSYVGPDRRFKNEGVPPGMVGRRASDLSATVGDAIGAAMSQNEIDDLMKPQRLSL